MRGKAGPKPETKKEAEESNNDPTAEEIVGAENVIDVSTEEAPPEVNAFRCSLAGCKFYSKLLSEMEEHVNGTGHGGYKTEEARVAVAVQPELFRPPGTIRKEIRVPFDNEFLDEKRKRLAALFQHSLDITEEKKATDQDCNARLKNIDNQMQEIARLLKTPFTYETKDCEWRIIEGENARGLYRLDTGELVEKAALTGEDRAEEIQKAETDNAAPEIDSESDEDAIPEVELVN